jgi:hypothetical protein
MAGRDENTYGFRKDDADALIAGIGMGETETPGRRLGSGGAQLFRFTLNASLASGTADADILLMDGTDTGIDASVLDPLGIFASLVDAGDTGLCLRQGGSYYVIQAACPEGY